MKKTFFYFLAFWGLAFLFNACKDDDSQVRRGSLLPAKFVTPSNNSTIQQGKPILVKVDVAANDEISNLKIFTKDTTLFDGKTDKNALTFEIESKSWNIGRHQFHIEVKTTDNKTRKDQRVITLLPNVFPKDYSVDVLKVYPHNTSFYTQGLEFDGDQLYEGTGGKGSLGSSRIAKVNLETGEILNERLLGDKYFGEGITIFGDEIFQLTWQEHTCFVFDKNTLEEIKTFTYSGEGWGLCNDGEYLIMSDGTERLYFRDPRNFNVVKILDVYSNEGPMKALNELEYINGKIYANVYTTNQIVIIDVETGIVTGKIDASLLALDYRDGGEVLNGIAYKKSTKQLFLTGKNWPNMLEVVLVEE